MELIYHKPPDWTTEMTDAHERMSEMTSLIYDIVRKAEDDCIKGVLRQILKREPTTEDAKDCQRILYPNDRMENQWHFGYKGVEIGIVKTYFTGETKVVFTPAHMYGK